MSVRPPVVVPAATLAAVPVLVLALRLLAGPTVQESPGAEVTQAAPASRAPVGSAKVAAAGSRDAGSPVAAGLGAGFVHGFPASAAGGLAGTFAAAPAPARDDHAPAGPELAAAPLRGVQDAPPPASAGTPLPASADSTGPAAGGTAAADSARAAALAGPVDPAAGLTYEREFFWYEGAGRRDPFQPLLDLDLRDEGPRFDTLVLTGIFVGDGGPGMVVVEDETRKGYFLKPGDRVGRASLVEIRPDHAVFDVHDFGVSRRDTLRLQRPEDSR
ncbi:MAG TPA: hypothetical protein VIC56_06470 [Gemmatimonadota bacterium]